MSGMFLDTAYVFYAWMHYDNYNLPRSTYTFAAGYRSFLRIVLNVLNVLQKCENKIQFFSSYKAHRAALISISLELSQTPVYTARPRIRNQCIAQCAFLCSSYRWYSLCLPTEGWPGWVDLGRCLSMPRCFTRLPTVIHSSTNRARRWLTLLILPTKLRTKPYHRQSFRHRYFQRKIRDLSKSRHVTLTNTHCCPFSVARLK